MTSAEDNSTWKDRPTPISTNWSVKSFPRWSPPSVSMAHSRSTSLSSKQTWCPTREFISYFPCTVKSFPLRKPIMNKYRLPKLSTHRSILPQWWSSVTQDRANIWPAAWYTVETLSSMMSTLRFIPSRPRELSRSSIGIRLDSRVVLTISHPQSSLEEISPR